MKINIILWIKEEINTREGTNSNFKEKKNKKKKKNNNKKAK